MNEGVKVGTGDREADVVTSGEVARVGNGWRGAPWTFGKLGFRVSLDEVELKGRGKI